MNYADDTACIGREKVLLGWIIRKFKKVISEEGWEMNESKSGILLMRKGGIMMEKIEGIKII